jgi:putative mRNA 3-end processing factor
VVEATYGVPAYNFPSREKIYGRIVEWAIEQVKLGRIPTFRVYAVGKAQEIIKLFNVYTKLQVVSDPKVWKATEVCSHIAQDLDSVNALEEEGEDALKRGACVFVTTSSSTYPMPDRVAEAAATGWALNQPLGRRAAFPLSSHADFNQLINFVEKTKAKTVHIFTGYADEFASYLKSRLNVNAQPITPIPQRTLDMWETEA